MTFLPSRRPSLYQAFPFCTSGQRPSHVCPCPHPSSTQDLVRTARSWLTASPRCRSATSCAAPTARGIVLLKRAGVSTCSAPSKTNCDPGDTAERAPVGAAPTRALSCSYGMAEHATLPLALSTGVVSGVCSSRASRLSR